MRRTCCMLIEKLDLITHAAILSLTLCCFAPSQGSSSGSVLFWLKLDADEAKRFVHFSADCVTIQNCSTFSLLKCKFASIHSCEAVKICVRYEQPQKKKRIPRPVVHTALTRPALIHRNRALLRSFHIYSYYCSHRNKHNAPSSYSMTWCETWQLSELFSIMRPLYFVHTPQCGRTSARRAPLTLRQHSAHCWRSPASCLY